MDDVRPLTPTAATVPVATAPNDVVSMQPSTAAPTIDITVPGPAPRAAVPPAPTVAISSDQPANTTPSSLDKLEITEAKPTPDAFTKTTPADSAPIDFSAESTSEQEQAPEQKSNKRSKKHSIGPIIIAIIFALGLIGAGIFAYLQNQQDKPATTSQQTPESNQKAQTTPKTPATATDVLDTSNDIQKTIDKVNDSADANENDLSDSTLGI